MGGSRSGNPRSHHFGGDWTQQKLDIIAAYLRAYTTALKEKPSKEHPFRKAYIDAFAGTPYRSPKTTGEAGTLGQPSLDFPDLAGDEPQALLDGSARLALKTEPRFDHYIFIERDAERCRELETLKTDFPALAADIEIRHGDANIEIQTLCRKNWKTSRAVLFLDPYGMEVEWTTICAIARTESIDLWLLVPLGIGLNRLLTRSGKIPAGWRDRLSKFLGTENWETEFYTAKPSPTLFGEENRLAKARMDVIARYFVDRLKTVFPPAGVADNPLVLENSRRNPLYLLCFAAGNKKGAKIALRIANHLLTTQRGQ